LQHIPVLLKEILSALTPSLATVDQCRVTLPQQPLRFVDATLGGAGHSLALLKALSKQYPDTPIQWLGLDQDAVALSIASQHLSNHSWPTCISWAIQHGNFKDLASILQSSSVASFYAGSNVHNNLTYGPITGGILADIGVSSFQLDDGARGFSFSKSAPLDMRMDNRQALTAAMWLNEASQVDIKQVLSGYGEERLSGKIAEAIVQTRQITPLRTTDQLADLVVNVYQTVLPHVLHTKRIHPATQVFQAIRIVVNQELAALEAFLPQAISALAPSARLAVLSFHSLEDRVIKRCFVSEANGCLCPPRFPICQCGQLPRVKLIGNKPVVATDAEVANNPRSRSAKLRVIERI
jgi:16S rRNA (cytosine1402-N4)-methyltransferase